jgi:large subunit ribosomal protein L10
LLAINGRIKTVKELNMDRSQKEELVSGVREKLTSAVSVIVTRQSGLTVSEATQLRRDIREAGAEYKVLKNTLAQIAVQGTSIEGLKVFFSGPTAVAFSKDPVSAAKAIAAFAKKNNKLEIVGGCLDGQILNKAGVQALAELPSLDELRATFLALLNTPATSIARLVKEPGACIARVIAAKFKSE